VTSWSIRLDVSFGQLAVFAKALRDPFNDWTDKHVSQGFAWRPGSVSFRTMVEDGRHSVEIEVVPHAGMVSADALRVIEVPFDVPADGSIEVASISDSVPVSVGPGHYLLRCEFLPAAGSGEERARLCFARNAPSRFAVVRADGLLSLDGELLTTAHAAGR